MAMFAQLGDVVFQVTGPVTGMEARREYTYAEHEVIEGKPRLQYVGDGLEELTLELTFDAAFCEPGESVKEIRAMADRHEAVPFLFATGEVRGRYVVREIEEVVEATDAEGAVTRATCRVTLLEWAGAAGIEVTSRRKPATAVKSQQSAAAKKEQPASAPAGDPRSVPVKSITRG